MPCHYKSVKSFKWSIPNSDVKIDYHKKFSFQSFDFCVNSFVKGSLTSDRGPKLAGQHLTSFILDGWISKDSMLYLLF